MDKEIRKILDEAVRQGWRYDVNKQGHPRLFPPDGTPAHPIGAKVSDPHMLDNALAWMKQHGFRWPVDRKAERSRERRERREREQPPDEGTEG